MTTVDQELKELKNGRVTIRQRRYRKIRRSFDSKISQRPMPILQHKVFGIVELSFIILELIDTSYIEKNGVRNHTSKTHNIMNAKNTCYLWYIIGTELLKKELFYEHLVGGYLTICNLCHKRNHYMPTIFHTYPNQEKRDSFQNKERSNILDMH
jgi:hypothetical protein